MFSRKCAKISLLSSTNFYKLVPFFHVLLMPCIKKTYRKDNICAFLRSFSQRFLRKFPSSSYIFARMISATMRKIFVLTFWSVSKCKRTGELGNNIEGAPQLGFFQKVLILRWNLSLPKVLILRGTCFFQKYSFYARACLFQKYSFYAEACLFKKYTFYAEPVSAAMCSGVLPSSMARLHSGASSTLVSTCLCCNV